MGIVSVASVVCITWQSAVGGGKECLAGMPGFGDMNSFEDMDKDWRALVPGFEDMNKDWKAFGCE